MTDPIADMLTRLRNGAAARHNIVRVPRSGSKERLGSILVEEGFVEAMEVTQEAHRSWLEFKLKYLDGSPTFVGAKRVSRPGLRVYARSREIPRVMGGIGTAIISTSQGVMTGPAAARRRLGGEVVCFVW